MTFFSSARLPARRLAPTRFSLMDLIALRRERQALRHLDERALHDLGLTRKEAETEARRPFWDIPASRR